MLHFLGPDIARYFVYSQLESLFPGSAKVNELHNHFFSSQFNSLSLQFLPMIENVGQAALTVGPLVLIAPETMPVVASYVLLVAVQYLFP
jgi:hypothetical protein